MLFPEQIFPLLKEAARNAVNDGEAEYVSKNILRWIQMIELIN